MRILLCCSLLVMFVACTHPVQQVPIDRKALVSRNNPQFSAFDSLLTVVIIGVLFLAVRYYMQYLRRRYSDEKIRFFTRMAHDIRTSLMLIKAPIEELHKEKELSSWGAKCLTLASEQTARLSDTATQLLDFEKLDIGCKQNYY